MGEELLCLGYFLDFFGYFCEDIILGFFNMINIVFLFLFLEVNNVEIG